MQDLRGSSTRFHHASSALFEAKNGQYPVVTRVCILRPRKPPVQVNFFPSQPNRREKEDYSVKQLWDPPTGGVFDSGSASLSYWRLRGRGGGRIYYL